MRAVRIGEKGIEVVEIEAPRGEGVRVRVRAAGICGTDLHLISGPMQPTVTLGHEIAGVTDDGTPVAVEPLSPCLDCPPCRSGQYNLCETGPMIIHGVVREGGMADEMLVPERALVPLAHGLDPSNASLVEPLAVAQHGLRLAGQHAGQRVLVVGAGPIGLLAAFAARVGGAEVDVAARHDHQREVAERLGCGEPAGSYDLVVEAAGTESATTAAVEACRPGGTVALVASYWDGRLNFPAFAMCLKEIRIVPASLYCAHGAMRDIDVAAGLLARHPEVSELLITHRFPLDAAPEAFETAGQRATGAIKVVLEP
ncbi:MAG: alcohol dehydrogenase catalytic domain-containing protein [bacterium]|nr:alcohol dehydrogenase catalytic domain-containing protein [bacterium]MCP5065699.1 alcohol dehydrogenase catalytic domain-containing protein [bacterium]